MARYQPEKRPMSSLAPVHDAAPATKKFPKSENNLALDADRIAYLDSVVEKARVAAAEFVRFTQQDVDRIVQAMVLAGLEQALPLARLAMEETRLGVLEDKAI